jgi:putative transposase
VGVSPFFPPLPRATATATLAEVVHRAPRLFGLPRTRWTLALLRAVVPWLAPVSLVTVWHLLKRAKLVYKRGRRAVHSPDPAYDRRVARIAQIHALAARAPDRVVVLYQDELTYYRRPTVGYAYARQGSADPPADQGQGSNTRRRIASLLNAATGVTHSWQRASFDRHTWIRLVRAAAACYPAAQWVYVIVDNWPVHHHPEVRRAFRGTKVRLIYLPTYSPWLNPVEKFWRWLYQDVLHQHEWVNAWTHLQEEVQAWLDQWTEPAPELLRYVGLQPD